MAEPKLRAAALWEKTSAAGNRYFVGRWGGVRVLIFENRERKAESDPTHHLYLAEAPEKPRSQPTGSAGEQRAAATRCNEGDA